MFGGTFSISGASGGGTEIHATLPLDGSPRNELSDSTVTRCTPKLGMLAIFTLLQIPVTGLYCKRCSLTD